MGDETQNPAPSISTPSPDHTGYGFYLPARSALKTQTLIQARRIAEELANIQKGDRQ